MKKFFVVFVGALFMFGGAMADPIRAATVNNVKGHVTTVRTGAATQETRLDNNRGEVESDISNVSIGNLLSTDTDGDPTEEITANSANITVLQRDKLVVPGNPNGDGHCGSTDECGYVTTGDHNNNTTDKIWMKIE